MEWSEIPLVAEGGVMMLVLYGISVVGVGLVLERVVALRRAKVAPLAWMLQVRDVTASRGFEALGDGEIWPEVNAASALRQFLKYPVHTINEAWEKINWLSDREYQRLSRGVGMVGLFAAICPLLGLLGTVAGMILTFQEIASGGIGDPKALASGINQALYTTAAGLTLAIPFTVAFRVLRARAGDLADQIADFLVELWWLNRHLSEEADDASTTVS